MTEALPPEIWDRAVDPELPEGVVAFQDSSGQWWRYPLAEFGTADNETGPATTQTADKDPSNKAEGEKE